MAKQRLKSPRARLFVALELPDEVRDRIVRWQRTELEAIPVLRSVPEQNLHVTLAFLGHHPVKRIERLTELIETVDDPAPTMRFLPEPAARPKGRPRVFALEAESEGAIALQARLEERLVKARLYEPEKRPFWPHVTVARVRPERRGSKKPAKVAVRPRGLTGQQLEPFRSVRVTAYRSNLRPQGAEYVPLSSTDLKAST